MTEEISVNFEAKNPTDIKLLNRLYDVHLVLNDIAVRLDKEITDEVELTVPNEDDVQNLEQVFGKTVQAFTDMTEKYGDTDEFIDSFGGATKEFAIKLVSELVDFNNGIADIGNEEGGLAAYDEDKLNDWVNTMMGDIVETNESFSELIA